MKRYITFFAILLGCIPILSRERTKEEIVMEASKALQAPQNGQSANVRRSESKPSAPLSVLLDQSHLVVIGNSSLGYALIAKNADRKPLWGYTTSPTDGNNLAPDFLWLAQRINQILAMPSTTNNEDSYQPVAPLLKTQWGQDYPYNDYLSYVDEGEYWGYCLTGCVATALAQAIYYYRMPKYSFEDIQITRTGYGGETDTFSIGWFDYDNMIENYKNSDYTDEQVWAVGRLMAACGVACHMQFGLHLSYGYIDPQNLYKYFGYMSEYIDVSLNEISKALLHGDPILYGADKKGTDSHMMVLDGMDENGLVHINFGWNGSCDGYYAIDDMYGYIENTYGIVLSHSKDIVRDGIRYTLNSMTREATIAGTLANPEGQSYLKKIKIPTTLSDNDGHSFPVHLSDMPFQNSDITSLILEEGWESIPDGTFANCRRLTKVTLPSTLAYIGYHAFYDAPLEEVICYRTANRPPNCDSDAFGSYEKLAGVNLFVPSGQESTYSAWSPWGGFGHIYAIGYTPPEDDDSVSINGFSYALDSKTKTAILLPNETIHRDTLTLTGRINYNGIQYTVNAIKENAFREALSVRKVTLPSTITTLANGCFADCPNLAEFASFVIDPPAATDSTFAGTDITKAILYVPDVERYCNASPWNSFGRIEQYVGVQPPIDIVHDYEPAPSYLVVMTKEGDYPNFLIRDYLSLTFENDKLSICYSGETMSSFPFDDIHRLVYSDSIIVNEAHAMANNGASLTLTPDGLTISSGTEPVFVRIINDKGIICQSFELQAGIERLIAKHFLSSGIYLININMSTFKIVIP